jgi:hypothetical protein
MMDVIPNKWIEKDRREKKKPYDPYNYSPMPDYIPYNANKPIKRHTKALKANLVKTLRGVRK